MIVDLFPDPPESFVMNCFITAKPEDDELNGMFIAQDGVVVARLDGYAIVPREDYEEMVEILDELVKLCPDFSGG